MTIEGGLPPFRPGPAPGGHTNLVVVVTAIANFLPEEWHSVTSGVEAIDLNLGAADHQDRVDVGAVDAHAP